MTIIKINFLGKYYEFACKEEEIPKIKNLVTKLNNRVNQISKKNYNYSDTHKFLITSINLEDDVNNFLEKQKNLINKIDELSLKNDQFDNKLKEDLELKKILENISEKIKTLLNKLN